MLPSSYLAAAFLLALVPGWTYLRLRARRDPALPRTGLDQMLEVVAVGLLTTGLSLAAWALLPAGCTHLADITKLVAKDGAGYAEVHARRVVATVLVVALVAEGLAYALFHALHHKRQQTFLRETVWAGALGKRPDGQPWMTVYLKDGRVIEGWLHSYPTGDEHEHRDLALQGTTSAPLKITLPGEATVSHPADRLILSESEIDMIAMKVFPAP